MVVGISFQDFIFVPFIDFISSPTLSSLLLAGEFSIILPTLLTGTPLSVKSRMNVTMVRTKFIKGPAKITAIFWRGFFWQNAFGSSLSSSSPSIATNPPIGIALRE